MAERFSVGITDALLGPRASSLFQTAGYQRLRDDPRTSLDVYSPTLASVLPNELAPFDAVIALGERWTRASFVGVDRLLAIGRHGVGYDMVDTDACTEADVALFITPDGVRRPVASSILALLLAVSLKLPQKAKYSQSGQQDVVRSQVGMGLIGRTVGSIGVGNIGRDFFRLVTPLEMRLIAHDPYVTQSQVEALGATLVSLDALLAESDVVVVNCPLTPQTRGLINADRLARMKPGAILINTARGPIVDTDALVEALRSGRLAGAGLDVTDPEPLPVGHPLLAMDNVIVTSHWLVYTDQLIQGIARELVEGMLRLARGEAPSAVVNREVLDRPGFKTKLARWRQ